MTERVAERVVEPPEPRDGFCIVQQFHDARLFLKRRGNDDKKLPTRAQPRQTRFEVFTDRIQLQG